jgi:hypothetical protein
MKPIITGSVEIASRAWALLGWIGVTPTSTPSADYTCTFTVTIPAEHAALFEYRPGRGQIPGELFASHAGAALCESVGKVYGGSENFRISV